MLIESATNSLLLFKAKSLTGVVSDAEILRTLASIFLNEVPVESVTITVAVDPSPTAISVNDKPESEETTFRIPVVFEMPRFLGLI